MKIPVTLNGTKIELEADPEESLLSALRKNGNNCVKCGCNKGHCGACAILLDDNIAAACKIPAGISFDSDIVTLDYFKKTEEYKSIVEGFKMAGIKLCGYCDSGKIFSAYQIIKLDKAPTREYIASQVKNLSPCCTDLNTLVNGIIFSMEINVYGLEATEKKYRSILKK